MSDPVNSDHPAFQLPKPLPRTCVTVANKGGAGKTSLTLGLAAAIAHAGGQVLVVDLDQQCTATSQLLTHEPDFTVFDVMEPDSEIGVGGDAIVASAWNEVPEIVDNHGGIDVLPGDSALNELALLHPETKEPMVTGLLRALGGGVADKYDAILIDTPPSRGLIVQTALTAASHAIIPTLTQPFSLSGLQQTIEFLDEWHETVSDRAAVAGIVISSCNHRLAEEQACYTDIATAYPSLLWDPTIPTRAVVAKAQATSWPLIAFNEKPARIPAHVYATHATRLLRTFADPKVTGIANNLSLQIQDTTTIPPDNIVDITDTVGEGSQVS